MDHWLVRTASNHIIGPYTREQVIQRIQAGELGLQDEVCQANQYWIYLHEHQEVQRQLGIEMPRAKRRVGAGQDEEVTETQLENPLGNMDVEEDGLPSIPEMPGDSDGMTSLSSRRPDLHSGTAVSAQISASTKNIPLVPRVAGNSVTAAPGSPRLPRVMLLSPQIERPSFWRGFAWLLMGVACLLVYGVLKLLRV